jgi:lipopolysaccharide export system permease protein
MIILNILFWLYLFVKLIDRYILKHFIQNFLFGLFCFILIFVLVDLFENLDRFIDRKLSIIQIAEFYIYFIPDILKLITPVGMLLASLFTISRFINFSEFTAMRSAGISIYRYLVPIMTFGLIITFFAIYFNGWLVPKTNRLKFNFERTVMGRHPVANVIPNIYIQDKANRIISIGSFDKIAEKCSNVSIQIFNKDTLTRLQSRYDIKEMDWDTTKKDWKLLNTYKREFLSDNQEKMQFIPEIYIANIDEIKKITVDPELILKKDFKPEELPLNEFKEFIENLEASGQDASKEKVDYYSIISFPFASLVTILFGVSVSTNRRKGGAALQFGISIIVSFLYLGFVKISQVFGYNGDLNPIFTAWLANIIFLAISLFYFLRTQNN